MHPRIPRHLLLANSLSRCRLKVLHGACASSFATKQALRRDRENVARVGPRLTCWVAGGFEPNQAYQADPPWLLVKVSYGSQGISS